MTYAPATLLSLRDYLAQVTHLSPNSLGIVGDAAHSYGYHVGKDRIFSPSGQGSSDYSVKSVRDSAGLSDAASALDIGSFSRLRELSKWLVAEGRKAQPETSDIREIIYTADGVNVLRWDRERGYDSMPRTGESDASHLWHTHISWYRDAEKRDHSPLFTRFFHPEVVVPKLTIGATLRFSGPTTVFARTSGGIIGVHKTFGTAGLEVLVNELLVPHDPVRGTGGMFWRLTTGTSAGWLVSTSDHTVLVTGGHTS